ncbi:DUF1566 domain-containing protein [Desulfosarcina sp.]|uniref:Lcl domain-containing protein n=1 Tax=Desulfosarcina sp. TaxID=2027861 RepID=UPI003970E31B
MSVRLIEEFLTGDSKEIRDLASNEALLVGFLTLAKGIDDLEDINTRFYEESRSLYQVTSSGHSISKLAAILSDFFGKPAKAPGKNLPVTLRFDPVVKHLGGIRKDQALFLKKIKTGVFYGALWPWQQDPTKIEVLLGFFSTGISPEDYRCLGALIQKFLSKKKIASISEVGGQIHGISLPSFLQMSEMEGATYTLRVTSGDRTGHLYLDGGSLIAARYADQTGNAAAYRIISWDSAAIQIEAADPDQVREINDPLMHVMMESLKIKDEAGAEPASPAPVPPPPAKANMPMPAVDRPATEKSAQPDGIPARKTSTPAPKKPLAKVFAQPLQPEPLDSVPFQKANDRSVGKQNQMGRTTKLLIVLGVVIVFAIAVAGGGNLLKERQADRRYDQLIADLAVTNELDAQIVLMMQYLQANPNDAHRSELETRLNETNVEIEKQDYEKTIQDVNGLPIDENYEKKALSLYTAFLTRYPQSIYAKPVHAAIGGIRQLLARAHFEDLKKVSGADYLERHAAYREHLERFPQGAERDAVARMISDLAQEYLSAIEKQTAACDAQADWTACIAQCDRFLLTFTHQDASEKVNRLRSLLQDKQDVAALTAKAALLADDPVKARQVYADYLKAQPDTTQKEAIRQRIEILTGDLDRQAAWKETAAYASNPANDINSRIKRLDEYMQSSAVGPYIAYAQKLKTQLEPELQQAIRAQRADAERRKLLAMQQAEQVRRTQAVQRIQMLRNQVAGQLVPVAHRFVDHKDGTVTDRLTGLTWCLLDSHLDLERCISYEAAKAYVRALNVGGHSDWRLPTAGELAALYKNSPFFPGTGAEWYWTSESFARGFHRVVDVVTTVPETVFTRTAKPEASCGAVRAVR